MLSLPKECSYSDVGDYRPISLSSVLPKVFAHIVSPLAGCFAWIEGLFSWSSQLHLIVLVTAVCCVS